MVIPQFALLSHVSSFRLSSGRSGLALTLSMQPAPSCPAPARWWRMRASGLSLCWELRLGVYSVGFFVVVFPPSYVALWDSKTPHRPTCERISHCSETSPSLTILSLFLSFIFCPTSFQRERAAFPGAWFPLSVFRSCFVEVAQH